MTEEKGKPEAPVRIVPSEARPPTKNGGSPPAVAAVRMEALVLWVIQRVEKFPRSHKFTVGDRWIDTCLEVQTSLVEATYVRDKRGLLAGASRGPRQTPRVDCDHAYPGLPTLGCSDSPLRGCQSTLGVLSSGARMQREARGLIGSPEGANQNSPGWVTLGRRDRGRPVIAVGPSRSAPP